MSKFKKLTKPRDGQYENLPNITVTAKAVQPTSVGQLISYAQVGVANDPTFAEKKALEVVKVTAQKIAPAANSALYGRLTAGGIARLLGAFGGLPGAIASAALAYGIDKYFQNEGDEQKDQNLEEPRTNPIVHEQEQKNVFDDFGPPKMEEIIVKGKRTTIQTPSILPPATAFDFTFGGLPEPAPSPEPAFEPEPIDAPDLPEPANDPEYYPEPANDPDYWPEPANDPDYWPEPANDPAYEPVFIPLTPPRPSPSPRPAPAISPETNPDPAEEEERKPNQVPLPGNDPEIEDEQDLEPSPNPAYDQVLDLNIQPGLNGQPALRLRLREQPWARPRQDPARKQRKDKKIKHVAMYRAGLRLINRTYGTVDEIMEIYEILVDNIMIDGQRLSQVDKKTFEQLLSDAMNGADVQVDFEQLVIDLAINNATDFAIGYAQSLKAQGEIEMDMLPRPFG